jgi:hypothetical protein
MLLHKPHHLNWDEAAGVPEVSGVRICPGVSHE